MSLPRTVGSALYNALSGTLFRAEGIPYLQHVMFSIFRTKLSTSDYTKPCDSPSLVALYRKCAEKNGFEARVVELESGGRGVWFGSPKAKNVFFYMPGGGFWLPPIAGHMLLLHNLQKYIESSGTDFAIFCFGYDLLPNAKHPVQLQQAVAAFNYILKTSQLQPKDIILGGDSAGGNLSLMLLSHATHGFPGIEPLNLNGQSLRATVLVCPWVSMVSRGPNLERNASICFVTDGFVGVAGKLWISESEDNGFTSPLKNEPSWWKDVPSGDILVISGDYEYFVDDIDAFVEKIKNVKNVEYVRSKHEVHDHAIVTCPLGYPTSESELGLRSFVKSKL